MSEKGFLALLFDFRFTDFITKKLIRLIYVIAILATAIGAAGFVISSFAMGVLPGIVGLIFSPIVFLFAVAMVRIQLELVMVIFQIADNTRMIAKASQSESPPESQ